MVRTYANFSEQKKLQKKECFSPYKIGLGHQLFHCFGTSLLKMADVASYINALFVTISFIQTGQKVINYNNKF